MSRPQFLASLTSTAALVSNVPCRLEGVFAYNGSNATAFIQLFDAAAAASVTVGTTAPVAVVGAATVTFMNAPFTGGLRFVNGIVAAFTTTATGSSNPSAATSPTFVIS